ncbi:Reticulon-like protein B16 [Hibiscus syriacus]|uniref:Reticulon-like protein n=1 Tax=Hibiscus syriacus TaxID=106335 RepID=A0A6A3B0S2_HIBSY|nr:reticulon-like protein B16 isoform X1 [Hibiscus syriacus]KAE8709783.1 Reticulon-like protein B16 [Hibiscus syriacus]
MENSGNDDGEETRNHTISSISSVASSDGYRLFGRQGSLRQFLGGGKAADILLWKRRSVSFGIIVIATVAWLIIEKSGLSLLLICLDILLILIVVLFIHANYAAYRNSGQIETFPELELSEEMISTVAASFRVKINNVLLLAHDITIGQDFHLFFKVVICLWLLSAIGSYCSFFTLAYVGTVLSVTLPAFYGKYEQHVDKYCGMMHRKFSQHYRIVDESVMRRIPLFMQR